MGKFNHDGIKGLCKEYEVDILLIIKNISCPNTKSFIIIYRAKDDKSPSFLRMFSSLHLLSGTYQLIKREAISDYPRFINYLSERKDLEAEVL